MLVNYYEVGKALVCETTGNIYMPKFKNITAMNPRHYKKTYHYPPDFGISLMYKSCLL